MKFEQVAFSKSHWTHALTMLLFLAAAVAFTPCHVTAHSQQPAPQKFTLDQIEGLVAHGVPDATLSNQIRLHGLAFTLTPAILGELRVKGAGPQTLAAIGALFPKGTLTAANSRAGSKESVLTSEVLLKNPPQPTDYVSDFAHVLSPNALGWLDHRCSQLDHSQANAQVAVVTIPTIDGADVADYARELANKWGIGRKDSDRGVLVLLAVNDHKWRIEVGDGLEGILPDAKVGDIGREMIPFLRANDFDGAITIAVSLVAHVIAVDAKVTLDDDPGPVLYPASQNPLPKSYATKPPRVSIPADLAADLIFLKPTVPYPSIAGAARISGTVVLHALISETGTVEELQVISGPAMLQQAALDAVKTWRYRPYLLNNEPVEVETTVNVIFTLGVGTP
jgi:TonB family protein